MVLRIVIALSVAAMNLELWAADTGANAPVRIVCIGDSITQGRQGVPGSGPQTAPTYSYRYALWKKCVDAGAAVEFVGNQKTGFNGSPTYEPYQGRQFQNAHEGYWGWTTQAVSDKLKTTSANWKADIALIILGTNDHVTDDTLAPTVQAMTEIIGTLRRNNPKMAIIIGPPYHEWKPFPALAKAYAELAAKLSTPASPVSTVDLAAGWVSKPDLPGADTIDWCHPNPGGDAKLAEKFFAAMKPYLKPASRAGK